MPETPAHFQDRRVLLPPSLRIHLDLESVEKEREHALINTVGHKTIHLFCYF